MDGIPGSLLIGALAVIMLSVVYVGYRRHAARRRKGRQLAQKYLNRLVADASKGKEYALDELRHGANVHELFIKFDTEERRLAAIEQGERVLAEYTPHGHSLVVLFSRWMDPERGGFNAEMEACLEFFAAYDSLKYSKPLACSNIGLTHDELIMSFNSAVRTTFAAYLGLARTKRGDEPRFRAALDLLSQANTSFDLKTIVVERLELPDDWDELCLRYGANEL